MNALFALIASIYPITAMITHLWTVIIAFTEAGFFGGIITLFLPFLSQLYWIFQMAGENDLYVVIAVAHLILAIPVTMMSK